MSLRDFQSLLGDDILSRSTESKMERIQMSSGCLYECARECPPKKVFLVVLLLGVDEKKSKVSFESGNKSYFLEVLKCEYESWRNLMISNYSVLHGII